MSQPSMRLAGDLGRALPRRLNLTEALLWKLTCPAGKRRVRIYDAKVPGLVLAITAAGARSWYWFGRVKGLPKPIDYHLGAVAKVSLADARRRAQAVAAAAADGVDPRAKRQAAKEAEKTAITIARLWEAYRDQHLKPKGSTATLRTDSSRYDLHLSAWKHRTVHNITSADVVEFHRRLTIEKTPNVADKTIKLLRRMISWAKISPNPAAGKAVPLNGETQRERFLSREEIDRLIDVLEKTPNQTIADAIRFALLTGARRGNICAARWQDMHLDQGVWNIPRDQSKNRRPMCIALAPAAIFLLRRRQKAVSAWLQRRQARLGLAEPERCQWVFPGRTPDKPIREVKSTWERVRDAAGISDVRFHDLRHSLASHMAMSGASLLLIGKQLGHASKQSTMRYAHLEVDAVRPATEAAIAAMFGKAAPSPEEAGNATVSGD